MIVFKVDNWREFGLNFDRRVIRSWLGRVRLESRRIYERGLVSGPHTGRVYSRGNGRSHRASVNRAGAEYPHSDTGRLLSSMRDRQTRNSAVIGTNAPHAIFLRLGTSKMARRRMSVEALRDGALNARPQSRGWVSHQKGRQNVRPL